MWLYGVYGRLAARPVWERRGAEAGSTRLGVAQAMGIAASMLFGFSTWVAYHPKALRRTRSVSTRAGRKRCGDVSKCTHSSWSSMPASVSLVSSEHRARGASLTVS